MINTMFKRVLLFSTLAFGLMVITGFGSVSAASYSTEVGIELTGKQPEPDVKKPDTSKEVPAKTPTELSHSTTSKPHMVAMTTSKNGSLPQTGDTQQMGMSVIGFIMLLSVAGFMKYRQGKAVR
ncbi:LPXTG cell wall anchor domain-containing protein [Dellaglioa sp. BT-FLS60]